MPTYNNINYLSLPQQVEKNRTDIIVKTTKDEEQDVEIEELKVKDSQQDDSIEDIGEEIDAINDILASGGIIVSRRVETSAVTSGSGATQKLNYDVTIKESEDLLVIAFNENNDHLLKIDGAFTISAGFSVLNTLNQVKTVLLQLVAIDYVTLAETVIDSRSVEIPANTSSPINPNFIYERPVGNDILIVVRATSDIGVNVEIGAQLSVTSNFTIGGSGIATKDKNIGLDDVEAVGINEDELTLKELLSNYKSLLIEKDIVTNDTKIKRDGITKIQLTATVIALLQVLSMNNQKIINVANPEDAQDVVTKAFIEASIQAIGDETRIKDTNGSVRIIINEDGTIEFQSTRLTELVDPIDPQDGATKNYVDNSSVSNSEAAITYVTLVAVADSYQGVEIQKNGKQVCITLTCTGTASIGQTLFTIPTGFRPNSNISDVLNDVGSAVVSRVDINADGTVITQNTINAATKSMNITYNIV